jgi:hypothetical protein
LTSIDVNVTTKILLLYIVDHLARQKVLFLLSNQIEKSIYILQTKLCIEHFLL